MRVSYNYNQISQQAKNVLIGAFGPNVAIRTEQGENGQVFIRIVSDKFDGMDDKAKQTLIWNALRHSMQENAQGVALVLAFGTDQI